MSSLPAAVAASAVSAVTAIAPRTSAAPAVPVAAAEAAAESKVEQLPEGKNPVVSTMTATATEKIVFTPAPRITSPMDPVRRIQLVGCGLAGIEFELIPGLRNSLSVKQLADAAEHIMDLVGDHYRTTNQESGTVLWLVYKRLFDQSLPKFLAGIDTPVKQANVRRWVRDHKRSF